MSAARYEAFSLLRMSDAMESAEYLKGSIGMGGGRSGPQGKLMLVRHGSAEAIPALSANDIQDSCDTMDKNFPRSEAL